jgi:predicted metal-dependent peptidase
MGSLYQWTRSGKVGYPDGTTLPYDHKTMNVAMDLVINDILIDANVGAFNKDWLHDTSIATKMDSVIDAYKKLFKQQKGGGGGSGQGPGGGKQGFDQHLAPGSTKGQDPSTATQQRNAQEWKAQVAAGHALQKAQGKMPAGLDRIFGEVLEPKVDWREQIQAQLSRRLGVGSRSWKSLDKRLITRGIGAPGKTGFGTGVVVVGADTSGSIGDTELDMFFAEIAGILEDCQPQALYIMWCDAKVHRVDECEEASDLNILRYNGAPGGGGTSFVPVFEEIDKLGLTPEALVYLTDGQGTFPALAPSYPVIWGSIYEQSQYPFGDVIQIPRQAA